MSWKSELEHIGPALEQLAHKGGAFLTVGQADKLNTMTIGWGAIGYFWNKPFFIAAVRGCRYTHEFLVAKPEFTVSVPLTEDFKKALSFCGTRSGKEVNKFESMNLELLPGRTLATPVIKGAFFQVECISRWQQEVSEQDLPLEIRQRFYADGLEEQRHILYFGEITDLYRTE